MVSYYNIALIILDSFIHLTVFHVHHALKTLPVPTMFLGPTFDNLQLWNKDSKSYGIVFWKFIL